MLIICEKYINERNMEDEINIGDGETLKELQTFFKEHLNKKVSTQFISKAIKNNFSIDRKYKVYRIKF